MPRHLPTTEHPPLQRHPDTPTTPQVWVIDNYRVHRWYYREAPRTGDHVYYMDGTRTRITRTTNTRVYMANSCTMRRPYLASRLWTWAQPRLRHGLTRPTRTKVTSYAPNAATIYV